MEVAKEWSQRLRKIANERLGVVAFEKIEADFVEVAVYALPGVGGGHAAEAWGTVHFVVLPLANRLEVSASIVWKTLRTYRGESADGLQHGAKLGLVSVGLPVIVGSWVPGEEEKAACRAFEEALRRARHPYGGRTLVILSGVKVVP